MNMTHNYRSIRMLTHAQLALGVLIMGLAATSASADVLYDTTSMTDNGTFTVGGPGPAAMQNFIGGLGEFSEAYDMQVADDFVLSVGNTITSVTADFLTNPTPTSPAGGILVEFFQDVGGAPSNSPTAQVLAGAGDIVSSSFTNPNGVFNAEGIRFNIDLSSSSISLGSGTWWLSIVPVDESSEGLWYRNVSRSHSLAGDIHLRNGGVAHGNGYDGLFASSEWYTPSSILNRDIAMKVEGVAVPAPGGLAMLGLSAAFSVLGRRRRQQL